MNVVDMCFTYLTYTHMSNVSFELSKFLSIYLCVCLFIFYAFILVSAFFYGFECYSLNKDNTDDCLINSILLSLSLFY